MAQHLGLVVVVASLCLPGAAHSVPDPAEPAAAAAPTSPASIARPSTCDDVKACEALLAQKKKEAEAAAAEAEKTRKQGFWSDRALSVGASALGLFNYQAVGQQDGFGLQVGALADGKLVLGYFGHEWTSAFRLQEVFTAVPNPGGFLSAPLLGKTGDELVGSSEYRFKAAIFPWAGPFVQARAQTRIFPSWVLKPEATRAVRTNVDGTVTSEVIGKNLPLYITGWFEPLILEETAGAFVEPPSFDPWVKTGFKAAAAAQHVIGYGGYVLTDDAATPTLEMTQIPITNSVGVQGEARASGLVLERLGWGVAAVIYYPILALGPTVGDVTLLERTHVDLEATLSIKLAEWLSLDGVTRLRRQPFVLNDWQFQTQVLLTAGFQLL